MRFRMRKDDIGLVGKREDRFCDHCRDGEQLHLWAGFYILTFTFTVSEKNTEAPRTIAIPCLSTMLVDFRKITDC